MPEGKVYDLVTPRREGSVRAMVTAEFTEAEAQAAVVAADLDPSVTVKDAKPIAAMRRNFDEPASESTVAEKRQPRSATRYW